MFEKVIIQNIIDKPKFGAEYLEFIKPDYFSLASSRIIFEKINKYFLEFTRIPSIAEVSIELSQDVDMRNEDFESCLEYIKELENNDEYHEEFIKTTTQKWITDSAFENAVIEASEKMSKGEDISYIQETIRDIYSISFNQTIGNSFWRDTQEQQDYYHEGTEKIACNISELNKVCGGGVERKTLNLFMAPTATGKTTALCSLGASYLKRGYNVLYITSEMAEKKIRQRIEANFFRIPINDVPNIEEQTYFKKMNLWSKTSKVNLYVKEYPTGSASINHVRSLLDDLETKEGFIPDVVIMDYIGIMKSVRIKSSDNSYSLHKSIAEEVRGLMVERNLIGWSAIQSNRDGDGKSDLDLKNSAESYGTPMTADLQIGMIETTELKTTKSQIWKALKTRYSDLKGYKFKVIVEHEFASVSDAENDNGNIETEEESNDIIDNTISIKMKSMKNDNKKKLQGLEIDFD